MILVLLALGRTVTAGLESSAPVESKTWRAALSALAGRSWNWTLLRSGATLLELKALEVVDLVQQPSERCVQVILGRAHSGKYFRAAPAVLVGGSWSAKRALHAAWSSKGEGN